MSDMAEAGTSSTVPTDRDTVFFRNYAWVILGFVVIAFGGKAVFDTADLPPITLLHHFHAVSMLTWFVLFAVQASLIDQGNTRLHGTLGRLSIFVVATLLVFAVMIAQLNWARVGGPLVITSNFVNSLLFVGFYVGGALLRQRTQTHRRLMLFATLSYLGPASGRIPEILDASVFLGLPIMLAFVFTPLVYEGVFKRKVHPATLIATGLIIIAIPVQIILSGLPAWVSVMEAVLGPGGVSAYANP